MGFKRDEDGYYTYGKCLDSCKCGSTLYVKTTEGCFAFEDLDEDVRSDKHILRSRKPLMAVPWPLPC